MKIFKATLFTFLCLFLFTFTLWWIRIRPPYGPYLEGRPPEIPNEVFQHVGWYLDHKKSSFTHFSKVKKKGVLRIGCFGDSFTYGDEVGLGQDYPRLLLDEFKQNGQRNVEVLNFGIPGASFAQTFIMINEIGLEYNLDYILLGPGDFFEERDLTFKTFQGKTPIYHSRFIWDKNSNDVKQIDLSMEEKKQDAGFFPSRKTFLYDTLAPSFLRALIIPGRNLENPFYYFKEISRQEEMMKIYDALFKKIPSQIQTILTSQRMDLIENFNKNIKNGVAIDNAFGIPPFTYFPYKRRQHYSPLGNRNFARLYYSIINKKKYMFYDLIDLHPKFLDQKINSNISSFNAQDVVSISVSIGHKKVGEFISHIPNLKNEQEQLELANLFSGRKYQSLLFIYDNKAPSNLITVIPLKFSIKEGESFFLKWKNQKVILHKPIFLSKSPGVYVLSLKSEAYLQFLDEQNLPRRKKLGPNLELFQNEPTITMDEIWGDFFHLSDNESIDFGIGNKIILRGRKSKDSQIKFIPVEGQYWQLIADKNYWPKENQFHQKNMILNLSFTTHQNKVLEIPLYEVKTSKKYFSLETISRDKRNFLSANFDVKPAQYSRPKSHSHKE